MSSCIIDAEIVAVDGSGVLLPFQTLMNRARKDVDESAVSIHVQVFLFDLMQLNGTSLLHVPFRLRDDLMRACFKPVANRLDFVRAERFVHAAGEEHDVAAVRAFLRSSFEARCEGVMVKVLGPPVVDIGGLGVDAALQRIVASLPPPELGKLHSSVDFAGTRQHAAARLARAVEGGPAALSAAAATASQPQAKRPKPGSAAAKRREASLHEEGREAGAEVGAETAAALGRHVDGNGPSSEGDVDLALSTYQPSKRCENWLKVRWREVTLHDCGCGSCAQAPFFLSFFLLVGASGEEGLCRGHD